MTLEKHSYIMQYYTNLIICFIVAYSTDYKGLLILVTIIGFFMAAMFNLHAAYFKK